MTFHTPSIQCHIEGFLNSLDKFATNVSELGRDFVKFGPLAKFLLKTPDFEKAMDPSIGNLLIRV